MMKRTILFILSVIAALGLSAQPPVGLELHDPQPADPAQWQPLTAPRIGWGSTDIRYRRSEPAATQAKLTLYAWRGERVSAQAVISTPVAGEATVTLGDLTCGRHRIAASQLSACFVGYTMSDHTPLSDGGFNNDSCLMPDPLLALQRMPLAACTTRPVWLTVQVPADAQPGKYTGTVTLSCGAQTAKLPLSLVVSPRTLPAPSKWAFHLDLWQNPYAAARYFNVPLWSQAHFDRMRPVMERYAQAGGKVITASIIQHPWNGQTEDPFESMIVKMKTIDGRWQYDYTVFDHWVEFMMSCGVTAQIDCYTLVPWHYKFDYFDMASATVRYVACKPGTAEYDGLILPFLKDFAAHLKQKGWFSRTCIAMDERPMDQLSAAYDVVKRADPDYRVKGAINTLYKEEVESKMYDASTAYQFEVKDRAVLDKRKTAGKKTTFYTCCGPDRPNTFVFSPPAEATYLGWHAAGADYDGYLRWAYNSWVKAPLQDARFRTWYAADCFLVYPEGSSIRFERLVQGIQDFEKIRILKSTLAPKALARLEAELEKFRSSEYPKGRDAAKLVGEAEALLRTLE